MLVVDLGNLKKCPLEVLEIQVCRMIIGLEVSIRGTSSGTDACNQNEDKIV